MRIDCTDLANGWQVLQVSLAFERRALPLRLVRRDADPEVSQAELLTCALEWLAAHLPGNRAHYVLLLDRGFPSHRLIRLLTAAAWRFVMRLKDNWKLTHPEHTGGLREVLWATGASSAMSRGSWAAAPGGEASRSGTVPRMW